MKICKKCNQEFPSSTWINGKQRYLHKRSYCLECSPLHKFKGYEIRKEQTPDKKKCPICQRVFKYTKNNVCTACRTALLRYEQRGRAYALLGSKCKNCSEDDPDILTCHHRNPDEKKFNLCSAWGNIAWELIEIELKKCDLLCANCHMKTHANENQSRFKLITEYLKHGLMVELAYTADLKSAACNGLVGSSPTEATK